MYTKLVYSSAFMAPSADKRDDLVHIMTGGDINGCPSWQSQLNQVACEQVTDIPASWSIHSDTRITNDRIVLKKNYGSHTIFCMLWQNGVTDFRVLFSKSQDFAIENLYSRETVLPTNVATLGIVAMTNSVSYQSVTIVDRPGFFAIMPNSSTIALCQITVDDPAFATGTIPLAVYENITNQGSVYAYHPNSYSVAGSSNTGTSGAYVSKTMQMKHSFGWISNTSVSKFDYPSLPSKDVKYIGGDNSMRIPLASFGFVGYPVGGGWNTPISNVYITANSRAQSGFTHNGTVYRFHFPGFLIPYE